MYCPYNWYRCFLGFNMFQLFNLPLVSIIPTAGIPYLKLELEYNNLQMYYTS